MIVLLDSLVRFKRVVLQFLDKIKGPEFLAITEIIISVGEFIFMIHLTYTCNN